MEIHKQITDSELLERFGSSGSQAAFAELVQRHGVMVRTVAMRVLANHHDAEDVTQAVFIKLAAEAKKLKGQSSVAGWLHTVSHRLSLNAQKSRESRQKREHSAMNQAPTDDALNDEMTTRFRRELDAALARLPERYRQPLVIFHLEGTPLHKCAEILQLNPGTLRSRLSRARDMLRDALVRRGVEIASVTALSSLLAAEAKAGSLPPTLVATILNTAGGGCSTASPAVSKLANTALKFESSGIYTLILTPLIIMKTKTTATAIAALIIGLCATVYFVKKPDSSVSSSRKAINNSTPTTTGPERATRISVRKEQDSLAKMSRSEFYFLLQSIVMITNDEERLAAIREKLGMNVSDEIYRKAVADIGYDPILHRDGKLIDRVFNAWIEVDPNAAMDWWGRLGGDLRSRILKSSIEIWMDKDKPAAMAWVEENLKAQDLETARGIIQQVEQKHRDKLSVADIAREMLAMEDPNGENRDKFMALESRVYSALVAIAKDDPQAALHLFRSFDAKVKDDMKQTEMLLYEKFIIRNPAAALASYKALPPQGKKHLSIVSLYSAWAGMDPDAALASAKSLDNNQERSGALLAILPKWQFKHPQENIEQTVDLSALYEVQYGTLIVNLVEGMAMKDPASAAAYSMGIEDMDMKQQSIARVATVWAMKDPKEAEKWTQTLPEGELRDGALSRIASWISFNDIAYSGQLVSQIHDPAVQHEAIKDIITEEDHIRRDYLGTLELANQLPSIDTGELERLIRKLDPKNAAHFEVWLKNMNTQGKIKYSSKQPKMELQEMLDDLKAKKQ